MFCPRSVSEAQLELPQLLVNALAASVERWKFLRISYSTSFLSMLEQALGRRHSWSMQRLRKLVLTFNLGWIGSQNEIPVRISIFLSAPNLRHIDFGHMHNSSWRQELQLPWQQIEQLDHVYALNYSDFTLCLRQSPNLIRFDVLVVRSSPPPTLQAVPNLVRHPVQSLSVHFRDECTTFLRNTVLSHLRDLRITHVHSSFPWEVVTSFMSASSALRRLVLRIRHFKVLHEDMRTMLHALPRLEEFELFYCQISQQTCSNELFADLTLTPSARCDTSALLPNLRVLSLVGVFAMDPIIFTAMIRSRSGKGAPGTTTLQSLHMYIMENDVLLTSDDLAEVKALMGYRAHIYQIDRMPFRSPTFPDLL
ncbi:hypothetical protein HWV62_27349 [Athelia sp. TMB]|nr:hypothetical protein HWV62_27349 [Athelia sp. TMB]